MSGTIPGLVIRGSITKQIDQPSKLHLYMAFHYLLLQVPVLFEFLPCFLSMMNSNVEVFPNEPLPSSSWF